MVTASFFSSRFSSVTFLALPERSALGSSLRFLAATVTLVLVHGGTVVGVTTERLVV